MGPFNQFKKMFAPTRVIATVLVFITIAMTLFAALHVSNIVKFLIYGYYFNGITFNLINMHIFS